MIDKELDTKAMPIDMLFDSIAEYLLREKLNTSAGLFTTILIKWEKKTNITQEVLAPVIRSHLSKVYNELVFLKIANYRDNGFDIFLHRLLTAIDLILNFSDKKQK